MAAVATTGEAYYADEVELMLIRHGREEWIYVTFVYAPVKNALGEISKTAVWVLENTKQVRERQAISASEQRFRAIVTATSDVVYSLSADWEVMRQFGQPSLIRKYLNQNTGLTVPTARLAGHFRVLPILDDRGEIVEWFGISSDITQRKRMEETLAQSSIELQSINEELVSANEKQAASNEELIATNTEQALVNQQILEARQTAEASEKHFRYQADPIPAKISNALPTGEFTFFNKQWLDYAGMTFEDLRDFGYHQIMHPDEIPVFQAGLAAAAAKGIPFESEMRFKDINGNYRWHLNIASPILNDKGEITMWVGSTTDIERMKEEDQRKNAFIGMVSHGIKSPLTSLNAYIQTLQIKSAKTGDMFAQNALNQSVKQVKRMTTMINGFLNVSRLESGKIHIDKERFDMAVLVKESEAETLPMYTTHKVIFKPVQETFVIADRDKIMQVINNFISNAVKYSKPGTSIQVACVTVSGSAQVSVSDEGMGIESKELNRIFERYYRVGDNGHVSGFGIGLYLCGEIIGQHNGRVWAESEIGKGSTFYFSLPIQVSDVE